MKHHRFLSVLLILTLFCTMFLQPAAATDMQSIPAATEGIATEEAVPTDLQLQCGNAVLMDATFGQVLYEHAAYDRAYPASMTKVMTALLTLEAIQNGTTTEDTMVTVSEYAAQKEFANESTANLVAGEQVSVKDLLYCIMLPSANDAAKALAEHLGGSITDFVQSMNDRAKALGCQNTNFVNPNGLHDPNHYSCAYDIALIFRQAMQHDLFLNIIATDDYIMPATNLSSERYFYNTNGLISNLYYSGYVYEKCIGGKTGSTEEAGKCLASAARSGNNLLISVVMGAGLITQADGSQLQGQLVESRKVGTSRRGNGNGCRHHVRGWHRGGCEAPGLHCHDAALLHRPGGYSAGDQAEGGNRGRARGRRPGHGYTAAVCRRADPWRVGSRGRKNLDLLRANGEGAEATGFLGKI